MNKMSNQCDCVCHTYGDITGCQNCVYGTQCNQVHQVQFKALERKLNAALISIQDDYEIKINELKYQLEHIFMQLRELDTEISRRFNGSINENKKPFKCPVCEGKKIIYTYETYLFDIKMGNENYGKSACSACEGTGIVWG